MIVPFILRKSTETWKRDWTLEAWAPFLEGAEKLSHTESHSKISNLITELLYSHILNMSRGYLHTRSFKRINFAVF